MSIDEVRHSDGGGTRAVQQRIFQALPFRAKILKQSSYKWIGLKFLNWMNFPMEE